VRRHLTKRLPPPPPGAFWEVGTTTTLTGWHAACHLRQRFHRGFDAALVVSIVDAVGGRQGGGEKASGSPGSRGEEDKYRGWKVQGGVDEAQRMREEEDGECVGGRDRKGVPRAGGGGRARLAGKGDAWWGPDDRAADAPPSRFGEGGLSSRPQSGDHCVPRGRRLLERWVLEVEE
jgi:hypothetical protein